MFPRSSGPIEAIVVERLDAKTVRAVARRLEHARSFRDFVYRESEMDALFTLADIAITTARTSAEEGRADNPDLDEIARIRDLIFEAHDFTHDNDVANAVSSLERAASIIDGALETS